MKPTLSKSKLCAAVLSALVVSGMSLSAAAQSVLPRPDPDFNGKIGLTVATSTPDYPRQVEAPKGAPNVLLILTDDVGYAASSPFGGPIATPTFAALAKDGLRYNQFHTTAMCSPSRSALITGRNHHTNGTGIIMELSTGYPGYNSMMSKANGSIAEVLKLNGYNTAWFGKNHNVPDFQTSQVGPFDLWPTGLGFEYFYGFVGGETDQWHSAIYEGTKPIEAEEQTGAHLTHFDQLMADHAIAWMRLQHSMAPDKPFFAYYAPGTSHAPHHAPKELIAKFKGQFDMGWDVAREQTLARQIKMGIVPAGTQLTPRPKEIPAWDSLTADQKMVYSRMMEVYAGALAHADYQIGRVIQSLKDSGQYDNTVIIFIQGDNGASSEGTLQGSVNGLGAVANGVPESIEYLKSMMDELGGPNSAGHYPVGWSYAMNTPFQWSKTIASHFGGTSNGMVISWPGHIKDGGAVRPQFHHIIDIAPTILDLTHIAAPEVLNGVKQSPIEGVSMAYTFNSPSAPTNHATQYFELMSNRGIYDHGWMASTTPMRLPWIVAGTDTKPEDFKWELYDISQDFSQSRNLAASNPAKLKEMQAVFDAEAKKYHVYPLDSSYSSRAAAALRPSLSRGRTSFTYYPGAIRISEGTAPDTKNRSFKVTANVDVPQGGANGVLATQGGDFGGWGLFVEDGKPQFVYALSSQAQHKYRVTSATPLAPGKHVVSVDIKMDGGGPGKGALATLLIDGKQVGQGRIDRTIPARYSLDETFDVGEDTGTAVVSDYRTKMPFKFTGELEKLTIDLTKNDLKADDEKSVGQEQMAAAAEAD